MKKEDHIPLFSDFPEITTAAWEEKIRADLKGADYNKKLLWHSDEGIDVKPYYREEDLNSLDYLDKVGQMRYPASAPNGWVICQDIYPDSDIVDANTRIKSVGQ